MNLGQHPRLRRERVVSRIEKTLERGSVLIEAPAGYGKTTVLQQALASRRSPVAWVRCGPSDRHGDRLVANVLTAIQAAVPGAAQPISEELASRPLAPDPVAVARAIDADLERLLVDPLVVVLDDAEHLDGSEAALGVVAELVRAGSRVFHVALATRRPLGLRLARPALGGMVDVVGRGELTFDATECAQYLELVTGETAADDTVEAVMAATEGWPLAVEAVVHARGDRHPTSIRTPDEFRSYVREEILDDLDEGDRRFVLESSVPRMLTPEVLAALGRDANYVEGLAGRGLLLRNLGPERDAYLYHPLVREVLLEHFRTEVDAHDRTAVNRRIGDAYAAAGQLADAVQYWLDAEAWDDVVGVLLREGEAIAQGSAAVLRGWVDRLPTAARARPGVSLLEGVLESGAANHERAVELLHRGLAGDDALVSPAREWGARLALIDVLTILGRYEEAVASLDQSDLARAAGGGAPAAATILFAAHCLAALGRVDESERLASVGRSLSEDPTLLPVEIVRRAYIDIPAGRVDEAFAAAQTALAGLDDAETMLFHFYTVAVMVFALTEQGYLHGALDLWKRMGDAAAESLEPRVEPIAHAWQALLLAQTGSVALASDELARFAQPPQWVGYPHAVARATVAAARGEHDQTVEAARLAMDTVRLAPPIYRTWAAADLIAPLVAVGATTRAERLLAEALDLVNATFPGSRGRFLRSRLLLLRAWLSAGRGDDGDSHADLAAALLDAGDQSPHLLRREWDRAQPVVTSALDAGSIDPELAIGHISAAFPDGLALVPFTQHANPAVRRAALAPAMASGHPAAAARLSELRDDPDPRVAAAARGVAARIGANPPPRVFTVLGGFSFRRGAWRAGERDWGRPAAIRLVRFLLVAGRPVPEDVLFETFWPELAPGGARRSVQVAASRIRAVVDHPGESASVLEAVDGVYRLRLRDIDVVDSVEFETTATTALKSAVPDMAMLERARSLWSGEPLPEERYADWAAPWRERLVDLYVEVTSALVGLYQRKGEHGAAVRLAREIVELDPLDESAHRELMVVYARAGRRGRALRQYLECRRVLTVDLGVEPSAATSGLQARILAGDDI